MNMKTSSAIMTIMQNAARKASRGLLRDFGEVETLQVSRKGPADFVSRADKKAEDVIFENLRRDRPGYGFLMEEAGEIAGTDRTHRFIVDPLDGTTNYLHGIPHFSISIALERIAEDSSGIVAGLVYNPITDEVFFAEKGRGAFINDGDIFTDSLFATGIPFLGKKGHAKFLKELHQVMGACSGVRRMGSAALDLAWTAAGRYDGYWERDLSVWDIAAGVLICREAGLVVESLSGGNVLESCDPVVTNSELMPQLRQRIE